MSTHFYELAQFPRLRGLAANWATIREEFLALDAPVLNIDRVGKTYAEAYAELAAHMAGGGKYGWVLGRDVGNRVNTQWMQYALIMRDKAIPFAQQAMPRTVELLRGIEGIKICALSKMRPHSFLSVHRHPEIHRERLLQFHVTLDVSDEQSYAYLNVNGEFNRNRLGDAIVFDGSHDHFALNASPADRTILYMEFSRDLQMLPSQADGRPS